MASALSTLIRAFSRGVRWQQPDYKLVIYLIHFCDLEKKTNFNRRCCSLADRLDLLSVVFYWILQRTVQATFFLFEKRLPCRLKEILFTAFVVPNFWIITQAGWSELHLIYFFFWAYVYLSYHAIIAVTIVTVGNAEFALTAWNCE